MYEYAKNKKIKKKECKVVYEQIPEHSPFIYLFFYNLCTPYIQFIFWGLL